MKNKKNKVIKYAILILFISVVCCPMASAVTVDKDPLDGWSIVHFVSGYLLEKFGLDPSLLILWEDIEPHIWPNFNESLENQHADILVGMGGYLTGILL